MSKIILLHFTIRHCKIDQGTVFGLINGPTYCIRNAKRQGAKRRPVVWRIIEGSEKGRKGMGKNGSEEEDRMVMMMANCWESKGTKGEQRHWIEKQGWKWGRRWGRWIWPISCRCWLSDNQKFKGGSIKRKAREVLSEQRGKRRTKM